MRRGLLGLLAAAALAAPAPANAQLPSPAATCGDAVGVIAATSAHFTLYGSPASGAPAVSTYVAALETAYARQVTEMGWWAPPGGPYVVVIDGDPAPPAGGAAVATGSVGDNPHSDWSDGDAQSSCLHLADDFATDDLLQAAAARELNRMILLGIGALAGPAPDPVLTESSLALMEQLTFAGNPVALHDLWPQFGDSLGAYGGANGRSQWLALRGLTERFGTSGDDVLQDMWRATSEQSSHGLDALDAALEARGTTLGQAFHDYAVAVHDMRSCSEDELPFCFAGAAAYTGSAESRPEAPATGQIEDAYAMQWTELPADRSDVTLTDTADGGTLRATGVCRAGSAVVRRPLSSTGIGAGQSASLHAFPPPGCSAPALVLSSSSRTDADPAQSILRSYAITLGPPTVPVTVSRAGSGGGTVTASPGRISCGAVCSDALALGTPVTLVATPDSASTFAGWSGACSGSAVQCVITPDDAAAVTATFAAIPRPPETEISRFDADLAADRRAPRLGFATPKLTHSLRRLDVRITCPPTEPHRCSGYVAVTAQAAKTRLNLGRQAFIGLRGGRRRLLAFPLTARARRAIRRAGRVSVRLSSRTRDDAFNYALQHRTFAIRAGR